MTDEQLSQAPEPAGANQVDPDYVVGIGASAGGIEALREVLPTLPSANVAYVIAQHMSPLHPSMLTQVLARDTPLPVNEIEDGMEIEAGQIYLAPKNRDVELVGKRFVARQAAPRISPQPSINVLLESLVEARGSQSIGVVLSGTGSDGATGMLAVKAARGYTIVQDPATARYRAMPEATIDADAADYVVEPTEVGPLVSAILRGDTEMPLRASGRWADDPVMTSIAREAKRATGWDISAYKDGTLGRQLNKRITALGIESTAEYNDYIIDNPDESVQLRDSMLISVTGFLRDRKSFDALQAALRTVIRAKAPGETVRAWVAGCATGEEAYSIAMMLADCARERSNDLGVKVFATDISDAAMDVARRGIYPVTALKDIPEEWRERYFSIQGDQAHVHKHLRDLLVIARQDLTVDPPLVRMDLVTCRNLLIYLVPETQARVLASFHAALNPRGLLFLGRSESVPADMEFFATQNAASKIYMKTGRSAKKQMGFVFPARSPQTPTIRVPGRVSRDALTDDVRDRMLSQFAPPSVLVDPAGAPVHQVGDLSRFIGLPEDGNYTLTAMIVPSLRTEISAMLNKVLRDGVSEVSHTLSVRFADDSLQSVRVVVARFTRSGARGSRREELDVFALVSFIPQIPDDNPASAVRPLVGHSAESGDSEGLVGDLERELTSTRQHLQSVVEELESSNEELQAMNEELQASSEELQATNEELETTNEELQATNEELTTVNETLEVRTVELSETTVVLQNIQNAVHTAIVLVDDNQRVQQFSPLAVKVFGLVSGDLGVSISSLPTTVDMPNLKERIQTVMDTGEAVMTEVSSSASTYLMQIVAYRHENEIRGAVIALSDVTDLAHTRSALAGISEEFRVLSDSMPVVLYRTGGDLITPIDASPSLRDILQIDDQDATISPERLADAVHPEDRTRVLDRRVKDRESNYQIDYRLVADDGDVRSVREISRILTDDRGEPTRRVGLVVDVTGHTPE
ncbi:MAG: chemotaxis protein CheB [Mycobacterium sp.]